MPNNASLGRRLNPAPPPRSAFLRERSLVTCNRPHHRSRHSQGRTTMRKDIAFSAEDGTTLRGWHYLPEKRSGRVPTIVMAHGFSAVKEMYLDSFAEVFAAAGLAALVFDNRNFGASDGTPRQEIDPWRQVRDYRDAITFAETLPETDATRLGVWGSSYSGGHV